MKKILAVFDTISFGFVAAVTAYFSLTVLPFLLSILFNNAIGRSLERYISRNQWRICENPYVMWILPIVCCLAGYFLMRHGKTDGTDSQNRFFR